MGERIWIDREEVQRVISEPPERLSPEAHFGFNHEDDKAWVVAEAERGPAFTRRRRPRFVGTTEDILS
jgi:hypothetical protein